MSEASRLVEQRHLANIDVLVGEGAPTASARLNSVYFREDATDSGAWIYRNTDGGTTWETQSDTEFTEFLAAANTWGGTQAFSSFSASGTVTLSDGSLIQRKGAGTGTGDVIEVLGPDSTHGMKTCVYEATVSPAAVETALFTVPAMSVIDSVQANVESALTGGGTTVTFSIGVTGDVDAYGTATTAGVQADLLAKNSKCDAFGGRGSGAGASLGVFTAGTVALKLIGAATGGASAGNTALTVGSVKVRVVYRTLMSIVDAA